MTTEDVDGFAARMAYALHKDPADDVRRTTLHLWIIAVTLAWLVVVPLVVLYGLITGTGGAFTLATVLIVALPFTAAALATKNGRFGLGGLYVVLTLLMALPAAGIAQLG
ncbi:hypothetical protein [Paractinoplanes atraurantiacus]|uniref:Uncharacterized protein n=1 Tax=Paractinoplanes atraurantiacus TaxID=1036182 RepID=A0A285J917_9ACTN|nr:hypothetical protein [Actinoplanes atraurantiacus]SNY56815.1 hypothetical protein SAMN05421748_1185 [Actinoplanes atraurantiacus]